MTALKTESSNRYVLIDNFLLGELRRWKRQQIANEKIFGDSYVYAEAVIEALLQRPEAKKLIGDAETDTYESDTIEGAKKYADKKAQDEAMADASCNEVDALMSEAAIDNALGKLNFNSDPSEILTSLEGVSKLDRTLAMVGRHKTTK